MNASAARERTGKLPLIRVALLTGGTDRHYAFGMAMALIAQDILLDVVGSNMVDSPELHTTAGLRFLNLQGDIGPASFGTKVIRLLGFYAKLLRYARSSRSAVFHILWNNKLTLFDRTILTFCYKLLRKKLVLTAHNINAGARDGQDSMLNRLTLKAQYRMVDHILVHTEKMRTELVEQFQLRPDKITVIPFGINNAVPDTSLSAGQARRQLGIGEHDRVILFYGALKSYKGIEHLLAAFARIGSQRSDYRLVIAGEPKKGHDAYFDGLQEAIRTHPCRDRILTRFEFIPDEETETYFKAADVAVLPYTSIFQSGILFLAYSFGLPVVAADVGSFRCDVLEGQTGFICAPGDSADLARALETYFESDLFHRLADRRHSIREYVHLRNSWETVGTIVRGVYEHLDSASQTHSDSSSPIAPAVPRF